jgi:phosphomannomutase
MSIKFGTSGWRDIIGEGFNFPDLRVCTQAIAEEIFHQKNHNKPFIVGYDTRFLSEDFALEAARVLANNGIEVRLSHIDVPTPVVSHAIIHNQAGGGINITASHNPYNYSGLKFSTAWGGPALPETTNSVESICELIGEGEVNIRNRVEDPRMVEKLIVRTDFKPAYVKHIKGLLDPSLFKGRKLKIIVDPLYGTSRHYLPEILRDLGCDVEVLHNKRDVYYGGKGPDPSPEVLTDLIQAVKSSKAHLGLACDGDADRFAVVDQGGTFLTPNDVHPILLKYLCESRGWTGIVARSVMTTHAIDAVARQVGLEVKETPVGFKHIGEIMKEAESIMPLDGGEFVMGAEESGGFSIRGHLPEKDGILACLLLAEMVASRKQKLTDLIKELHKEVGPRFTRRINIKATNELVSTLRDRFSSKPPISINGLSVRRIVDIDGYKFIFSGGSWLGIRFSGTEPVIRLYVEGDSDEQLDILTKAGSSLLELAGGKAANPSAKGNKGLLSAFI